MFNPDLCGEENILSVHAGFFNGGTDLLFVEICLCSIEGAVTDAECVKDAVLALLLRNKVHAVAELRHFYAV